MASSLVQVEKVSLRERVAHALREAILAGEMEAGTVYSAPSLGSRFGVSATPVREAMLDLVREELVEIVPNKGFRVTVMDDLDLDQITELRMLVEPSICAKATPLVPEEDFPELRALAGRTVDAALAGDLLGYGETDRTFHVRLVSYAGNRRITELIADLRTRTRIYGLAALQERGELVESAREHLTIVDALTGRDPAAVMGLLRRHIGRTRGLRSVPRGADSPH
ncbi:GntR family transcriptional regulator (plasmid) [Pseudonocardia sp. EC080610-09]|uniref:GntR family transcriptional regulator n=1 Tax=unclassified Pseudonocardia TaxID=2619320 RepID=UPI000706DE67|nr:MULTISPECIES: GntR family transcriptional regulator [unclassified Pseudonocardia]ALL79462.1 GntR family transcriptional regulator [Pseudonocardia sp. EC080610-09]ALL85585.1 GntR family transcriptional regulator [Pseudonocardia sp. EC080619-01]